MKCAKTNSYISNETTTNTRKGERKIIMIEETKIREHSELREKLQEQIQLLQHYCEQYDKGNKIFLSPMSVTLRVLLKDTRNSHSLLKQLSIKDELLFVDSAHHCKNGVCCWEICENTHNIAAIDGAVYAGLVAKRLRQQGDTLETTLKPLCQFSNAPRPKMVNFDQWYNEEVLDDTENKMSRKNIIENIAEKAGGCHVDKDMTIEEATFRIPEALKIIINGQQIAFNPAPMYVSLRQIAWEVLESLKRAKVI